MNLENQVVIVTGAAGTLGRGICKVLRQRAMRVVVADLSQEACDRFAHELSADGGDAIGVALDVTSDDSVRQMVATVLGHYGRIDALVNNAGIIELGSLLELSEEKWDRVIGVNLKGSFLCARAVVPTMIDQQHGRIVNVASVAAKRPAPLQSVYAATKHGLVGLTQVWCQELAPHNITVNTVCPGFVDSPMWSEQLGPAYASHTGVAPADVIATLAKSLMPLGRAQQAEDIGDAVAYLCTADNVTGQSLVVDGGYTMC